MPGWPWLTAWLVIVACAGCGRLGFDPYGQGDGGPGGGDGGAPLDASPGTTGDGGAPPAGDGGVVPGVGARLQAFGGAGIDETWDVAVDGAGNLYFTGWFEGTADFGAGPVTAAGTSDTYVLSTKPDGTLRWAQTLGSTGSETIGLAIDLDAAGFVYVTGWFRGNIDGTGFGGSLDPSAGGQDAFVAAYTSAGEPKWLTHYGGIEDDAGRGIDADDSGNTYVVGWYSRTLDFGRVRHTAVSGQDAYLASFDAAGAYRWSMAADATFWAVAGDGTEAVHVSGDFVGTVDFGTGALTSADAKSDVVVMSYGLAGTALWAKQYGGPDSQSGFAIALDAYGNLAVAGGFTGSANLGGDTFTVAGLAGGYMMSLKWDGTHLWSRAWGGAGYVEAWGMGATHGGDVYAVGYLGGGKVTFGATDVDLPTTGVFVYSFSAADGIAGDVVILDGAGEDYGYGGAASGPAIYAVGSFDGTFELGGLALGSQSTDGFLVALP